MGKNMTGTLYNKLLEIIEREEPFLHTDLKTEKEKIADRLKIPSKELDEMVRFYQDKTFIQLLKTYRIEKAKEMLADPELEDVKIIEIAFNTGFGNLWDFNLYFKEVADVNPTEYRAFHKNFKKVTGLTPTEYKMQ